MKTHDQLEEEYLKVRYLETGAYDYFDIKDAFLYGYESARKEETMIRFSDPGREILRLVPTEEGFDIRIPDGIEMTEAAEKFIKMAKSLMLNSSEKVNENT